MIFLLSREMKKKWVVVVRVSIIVIRNSSVKVWLIWLLLLKL